MDSKHATLHQENADKCSPEIPLNTSQNTQTLKISAVVSLR